MSYGDIDVVADCGADPSWGRYCDDAFAAAAARARPGQTIGIPAGQVQDPAADHRPSVCRLGRQPRDRAGRDLG